MADNNKQNITYHQAKILKCLEGLGEVNPMELVELSNVGISIGSVYLELSVMQHNGFVESRLEEPKPSAEPRLRVFKITDEGREAINDG